jgi:hypothetical protein
MDEKPGANSGGQYRVEESIDADSTASLKALWSLSSSQNEITVSNRSKTIIPKNTQPLFRSDQDKLRI